MTEHPEGRRTRVRWVILSLLTCFSVVSYIERINLTVAARFIRDEFKLTDGQIGWSFSVFLISYTAAQLPAGYLVDRFGARRVLAIAALLWFAITLMLGLFVGRLATGAAQVVSALIVIRLMLGLVEAPTYPGSASAIARWFPPAARGMPNAIIQAASYGGEALTLVLMATVTAYLGWRNALFASAIPALLLAAAWWRWGTSHPETDPRVSAAELAYIQRRDWEPIARPKAKADFGLLRDPKLAFLSLAYFCQGYVTYLFFFWFYIYLVDARHFSIAGGGLVGALPTLAAAICAFGGGRLSDALALRYGPIVGRRRLILTAGLAGAACLLVGAFADNAWLAIGGFTLAVGTRGLVESAFWSTVNDIGGESSGLVGGAMNGMGNLGGVVSTVIAPGLVAWLGWGVAMGVAAAATALTGLLMFGVQTPPGPADRPLIVEHRRSVSR